MKPYTLLAAGCALTLIGALQAETTEDANVAEAKSIVMEFFNTLMGELQTAIKDGGQSGAVIVCNARAPLIAAELSQQTGWDVGRTSLKLRNPSQNAPDDWEKAVLLEFEQRKSDGEDVKTMAYAETIEADGEKTFRFMKAIPIANECIGCHGTDIEPEVASAIAIAYPDDQATGYALGDVRGAFTLSKSL